MTAQQSVMNSLFTAFAGFTAFGAAIVAVLAGGSALQTMADRWVRHAQHERPGDRRAWLRNPALVMPSTIVICLVVLGSGTGLLLSFLWIHTNGSHGWGWTYGVSEFLFWGEVAGVTVITGLAVVAAGVSSAMAARPARSGREQPAGNTTTGPDGQGPSAGTDGNGPAIRLQLGGDTLELTGVSPAELRRLTDQWLDCHPAGTQQAAGIPADERDRHRQPQR
jgi:hypothetical protein